jgi:hypothetical protein
MSVRLTDTQLVLLSAAAQRRDHCLAPSKGFQGAALQKAAQKLLGAGFVREVKDKSGATAWRRDEELGQAYGLKLTPAGLKAIAVDEDNDSERPDASGVASAREPPNSTKSAKGAMAIGAEIVAGSKEAASAKPSNVPTPSAPREGTKIAEVITLLARDQGATLAEIVAATNWLPHTARAALTGLRRRGYAIERRGRAVGARAYAIAMASNAAVS